jgi:hypothetical protein
MFDVDRRDVLQEAEDRLARIQGRPAERVYLYEGPTNEIGEYISEDKATAEKRRGIYVNTESEAWKDPKTHLRRASSSPVLHSVVHEGRHAYQHHAIKERPRAAKADLIAFHTDEKETLRWEENQQNLKDPDRDGFEAYHEQIVEVDADEYADAVVARLDPEFDIERYGVRSERYHHINSPAEQQFSQEAEPPTTSHWVGKNTQLNTSAASDAARYREQSQTRERAELKPNGERDNRRGQPITRQRKSLPQQKMTTTPAPTQSTPASNEKSIVSGSGTREPETKRKPVAKSPKKGFGRKM